MAKLPGMPPFGAANWSAPQATDVKRVWDDLIAVINQLVDDGDPANAYTVTNVTPDRAYDANATTIDEIADVLGTLIADLKAKGIIG